MNLIPAAPTWLLALLVLALLAGAIQDARSFKISNITCGVILLLAIVAMVLQGLPAALWQNGLVFAAVMVLGTIAFSAGVLGGGDVKLLAVLCLWFSGRSALALLAAIFVAGGVVAIGYILGRRIVSRADSDKNERRIPYGLAIAGGGVLLIALQVQPQSRPTTLQTIIAAPIR